jgi:hypothetical protein
MNTLALLAVAYLLLKPGDSSSSSGGQKPQTSNKPPPVDNTQKDVQTGFQIAQQILDLTNKIYEGGPGQPTSYTIQP